jgi:hypothetical protein
VFYLQFIEDNDKRAMYARLGGYEGDDSYLTQDDFITRDLAQAHLFACVEDAERALRRSRYSGTLRVVPEADVLLCREARRQVRS